MDDNFSEMVKSIMSDPEAMSKLMSAAQGLMGDGQTSNGTSAELSDTEALPASTSADRLKNGNEERIALISALRPFLSDSRRKNADSLIKMLKMMKLADMNKLLGGL